MIDLPGKQVFPENITSTSDGTLYVGSIADGGVLRVHSGSSIVEQWIKPGAYGTGSTFGLLADERSQTLWVCSNDVSAFGIASPGTAKGSVLVGFELKTAKGKVRAALAGKGTFCNDITIGPDGAAYVTNSSAAQILRLAPGSTTLEVWSADPQFTPAAPGFGLNGIAFGGDGNLYVNIYQPAGLYRVAVKDGVAGEVSKLKTSRTLELADGMRPLGGNRFAMIEGVGRVDRLTVVGDTVTVETLQDGFSVPTGVTITGDTAWVAEGQLSYLFNPAKRGEQRLPFRVYAVPLAGR
jgi:sugar lactone lactonase YvrE